MRMTWHHWLAGLLLSLALSACDKTPKAPEPPQAQAVPEQVQPSWDTHIADAPKRWIAAEAPLFIRFTHPVIKPELVNKPIEHKLVSLSNGTALNAVFVAENELRITPVERLPNNTPLTLRLHPNQLEGIEPTLDDLVLELHTIKQDFDLQVNGLRTLDDEDLMELSGNITTDDTSQLKAIKQLLEVRLNGTPQELVWVEELDRKTFRFNLGNIPRGETPGQLVLEWNGAAIGAEDKGARELQVPAQKAFEVTGVQVIRQPDVAIEIQFSDELDSSQDKNGLVTLNGNAVAVVSDGSKLRYFPDAASAGELELNLSAAIRSHKQRNLGRDYQHKLVLQLVKPHVRFVGSSAILPPAAQLTVPFEAAGVDSVQVIAFKTYADNIGQYLQGDNLSSGDANQATGRYLWRKVYPLPDVPRAGSKRFNLDLTELMAQHPEGLVRLELRIDRSNSIYSCEQARPTQPVLPMPASHEGESYYEREQYPEWYQQYYQSQGYYNYSERNNPCSDTYYSYGDNTRAARNFMLSNIGLMAKRGDDKLLHLVSTELTTGQPLSGVEITAYNFQQQPIGTGTSDSYGMLQLATDGVPFYVEARQGTQVGYLRLRNNEALPTNQFDVSGERIKGGLKGALYGERDVWRPGDDIFLTFVLEDKTQQLPANHPVTLDLFDPSGKKVFSQTHVQPVNDFYPFQLKTEETAPTGNYRAVVHVGNRYFDQLLKIEMVVPNRIKVELTPANNPLQLAQMPTQVSLFAQWLQGATAKNLKADSELKLLPRTTVFPGFEQFVFDDQVREFSQSSQKVFDGKLDDQGRASFPVQLSLAAPPPGMLTAQFVTRVFEESGNFSTILRPFELRPFDTWVGLNIAKGSGYMDAISRDQDHPVLIQALDAQGKPLAGREVQLQVYEIGWRWWWDEEEDNIAQYINNSNYRARVDTRLTSDEHGRIHWALAKNTYDWGRHLIRVCDMGASGNGHCASQTVYLGWSWDAGNKASAATQLMLSTDKDKYQVGDTAKVRLPGTREGRVLLSLENGSRVLESRWLDLQPGQSEIEIPVTAAMAPNVYVNLSLLLPHQQRVAEAPMRLYGIVPLLVENPATRLQPQLEAPEKVRPESQFSLKVSESQGRAMTYTLALVDEGLLGLTNFRAPDLHSVFYQREALGVRTWDLFDQVVGGYGASLERVLAIGGSDAAQEAERKRRERRFPPVVQFLGAFELAAGEQREHQVKLPPYMGAVRVMLVAGDTAARKKANQLSAYGTVEKTISVTQPVTLFATLPRVLGPGEEVSLPVNVFVSEPGIQQVDISLATNDVFSVIEGSASLSFSEPGDAIANLRLKVNDRLGKGWVKVRAQGVNAQGVSESAEQEIYIDSRSANQPSTRWETKLLAPGEEWRSSLAAHGMIGTNQASLEVSTLPALNLEQRLEYLIQYPHGCVEQTTSAAFPQLRLPRLLALSDSQKADIDSNIAAGLQRLAKFQQANGGFSYWPGSDYVNDWASNYAGHFMVEAKRAGYSLPSGMFDNWVKYQRDSARQARNSGQYYDESVQAYRLYTLALADKAELAAMNRLREQLQGNSDNHYLQMSRWLLAMAYQHLGLQEAAREIFGTVTDIGQPDYSDAGYTYGSDLRDRGLLLSALVSLQQQPELSWQVAEQVAASLSGDDWYSTQSIAWALLGMSEFAAQNGSGDGSINFSVRQDADQPWQSHSSQQLFHRQSLEQPQISLRNDHSKPIRVLVSNRGIPANLLEEPSSQGLQMDVSFMTLDNKPLDVQQLPQGTDFVAEVSISGDFAKLPQDKLEDIALSAVMPSGWQIRNERLEGSQLPKGLDYMDIRDDRVLGYFSLWRNYYWHYRYSDRNQTSISLRVILNASYAGKFYLPGWQVAAMYNEKLHARSKGYWVEVIGK